MKNLASAAMLITMADKRKPKEAPESQVDKEQVNKRSEDPSDEKDLQELFSWESAARPFKKRDRRFYINLGLMLFIIGLIALFLKEFFLVAVLLAIFFYYYVAGTVEPIRVEHRITNRGIKTAEHEYSYKDLTDFWFGKKYGDNILHVSTKLRFPSRLFMLISSKDQEKIKKILTEYLTYQDTPPVTWIDNTIEWFTSKLPASMR